MLQAAFAQPAFAQRRIAISRPTSEGVGSAWLWLDPGTGSFRPFVPGYSPSQRALYHRIHIAPHSPEGLLKFRARAGQCLFLDNELIFAAPVSGSYTLDLRKLVRAPGVYLLACWHPSISPDPSAFDERLIASTPQLADQLLPKARLPADPNRNIFIVLLLAVGLLYGSLRAIFGISLSHFLRLELATRQGGELRLTAGALPSTPVTVLFGFGFALSFSLLIVLVQANFENAVVLRYLFPLSDADILLRVALYTSLVAGFVLLRYVFLLAVGYVFDLTQLVRTQYVAFVRTLLLAGAYLPPTILLHLVLSDVAPETAMRLSNALLALLLVVVVARSAFALHARFPLYNLHLFAYLCATEVIPLLVLFRLIVFPLF
jgi:Domain of unknown function (DUF4271)